MTARTMTKSVMAVTLALVLLAARIIEAEDEPQLFFITLYNGFSIMFTSDMDLNPRGDRTRMFEEMGIALDDTTQHRLQAADQEAEHQQEMMAATAQRICQSTGRQAEWGGSWTQFNLTHYLYLCL